MTCCLLARGNTPAHVLFTWSRYVANVSGVVLVKSSSPSSPLCPFAPEFVYSLLKTCRIHIHALPLSVLVTACVGTILIRTCL